MAVIVRLVVGFLLAAGLLASCSDEPDRDAFGAITEEGDLSVFKFQVGDCFDDPSGGTTELHSVPALPCSEPHDNEVFHVYEVDGDQFPGQSELQEAAIDDCLDEFEGYVGGGYAGSRLEVFPITPTAESWNEGDREIVCAVYDINLEKLSGSMRGTGA